MEDRGNTTILNRLVSCVFVFIRVQIGFFESMGCWVDRVRMRNLNHSKDVRSHQKSRSWKRVCGVSHSVVPSPALGWSSAGSRYHETSEWGALDVCSNIDPCGGG